MNVFPALPGLKWNVVKTPEFSTIVQRAVSLRELRIQNSAYPLWTFDMAWDLLRDIAGTQLPSTPFNELKTLLGFFLVSGGSFNAFLFDDTSDNTVTGQQIGIGDGAATAFQLLRAYGSTFTFSEPTQNLNGNPSVFKNDWQGNQLQYTTARTNLLFPSQAMASVWSKIATTVLDNNTTAPDGTNTAARLTETVATSLHDIQNVSASSVPIGQPFTCSAWLKAGGKSIAQLMIDDNGGGNAAYVNVNLATGAVTASGTTGTAALASTTVTAYPSSWYRVSLNGVTLPAATTRLLVAGINTGTDGPLTSYTGNTANYVFAWAAQIEMGAVPTSYIPTTVATASFTDCTLSTTGLVTFSVAPAVAAILTWTGKFYYRCRFVMDTTDFNLFAQNLWENKKLQFVGAVGNKV